MARSGCRPRGAEKRRAFRTLHGSDGIYEFKPKPYRIFCFFDGRQIIVCTHAFKKKTNIKGEIRRAERLRALRFQAKAAGALWIGE